MITRYNDLAANERTYLAWLRTALALIAFGFVLERFDLLLRTVAKSLGEERLPQVQPWGREAGIALVVLGLFTIATATWRFSRLTRLISSERTESYGSRSVLLLGAVFFLVALFMLFYVTAVIARK